MSSPRKKMYRTNLVFPVNIESVQPMENEGYLELDEMEKRKAVLNKGCVYWNDLESPQIPKGNHMFVVGIDGELYIADCAFHSQINAGDSVLSAGHLIIRNNRIAYIDNSSGHYTPSAGGFLHAMHGLVQEGFLPHTFEMKLVTGTDVTDNPKAGELIKGLRGKNCMVAYNNGTYLFEEKGSELPQRVSISESLIMDGIVTIHANDSKPIENESKLPVSNLPIRPSLSSTAEMLTGLSSPTVLTPSASSAAEMMSPVSVGGRASPETEILLDSDRLLSPEPGRASPESNHHLLKSPVLKSPDMSSSSSSSSCSLHK